MKQPVDMIFAPVEPGYVPYWRLVLRGFSQLCFQTNELAGVFFFLAVLVASPIAAAYMFVASALAPAGRMLLGDRGAILSTGLPGLNPCLIAISLPAFYQTGWTNGPMWGLLLICVACTVLLVWLMLSILPFPILALPFLIIFWTLGAVSNHLDFLQPIVPVPASTDGVHFLKATIFSLGQAVFAPTILSGVLFLAGMALSELRQAVLAVLGAMIGTLVAYYYREADPVNINLGLYGFNGVLAAVATYVMCGNKFRLAIVSSVIATMLMPIIADLVGNTVSAPFVFTTLLMLALGWIDDHWSAGGATPTNEEGAVH